MAAKVERKQGQLRGLLRSAGWSKVAADSEVLNWNIKAAVRRQGAWKGIDLYYRYQGEFFFWLIIDML